MKIPFNRPYTLGTEFAQMQQAIDNGWLSGNGHFSKQCHAWLETHLGCQKALLTHSCTAALEMAAILADIQPGDEVIMPSYTFVSTANAFVLRGGVPVFVDIRPDTLTLDAEKIEAAITNKTRAIVPVHYAGVACDMDRIMEIANHHKLWVIEDAAQAIFSKYKNKPLGSIGHLATLSFHETKNVICGEGGALLVNYPNWVERAEIIWEKGTNRSQFFRGEVDKYTWVDVGSSYLPNEISAAFLWAQLQEAEHITHERLRIWQKYHDAFADLEQQGKVRRPIIPDGYQHNAHLYYLLLPNLEARTNLLKNLKEKDIHAVFHYVPLHSSPAGQKFGRSHGDITHTDDLSSRLVRLPLWVGMSEEMTNRVLETVQYLI
jgi:dTDP-4-amino-4,6-dideoxygalactose transaminase